MDFVVHVFLAERRAFYNIERLRKSARPLTPVEFDEELKAALAAKTRAARGKAAAKDKPVRAKSAPAAKKAAKRATAVAKAPAAKKKAVPRKTTGKKPSTKK